MSNYQVPERTVFTFNFSDQIHYVKSYDLTLADWAAVPWLRIGALTQGCVSAVCEVLELPAIGLQPCQFFAGINERPATVAGMAVVAANSPDGDRILEVRLFAEHVVMLFLRLISVSDVKQNELQLDSELTLTKDQQDRLAAAVDRFLCQEGGKPIDHPIETVLASQVHVLRGKLRPKPVRPRAESCEVEVTGQIVNLGCQPYACVVRDPDGKDWRFSFTRPEDGYVLRGALFESIFFCITLLVEEEANGRVVNSLISYQPCEPPTGANLSLGI